MKQAIDVSPVTMVRKGRVRYYKEYTENDGRLIGHIEITQAEFVAMCERIYEENHRV